MRSLLPTASAELSDDDLDALYAWPKASWLRSNMVSSVDGAAQSEGGGTRTLSSDADRRVMGVIRALADAIVVGAGTARVEGYRALRPRARYVDTRQAHRQTEVPALVLVSRTLDLDPASELFAGTLTPTLIVTSAAAPAAQRAALSAVADVVTCGAKDVELPAMIATLHDRGLTRLVAEGGPSLLGALLRKDLVDDMAVTIAPVIAGDFQSQSPSRIVTGVLDTHTPLKLAHLLEGDGSLFARYEVVHS